MHEFNNSQKCWCCSGTVLVVWFFISLILIIAGHDGASAILSLVLSSLACLVYGGFGIKKMIQAGQCSDSCPCF